MPTRTATATWTGGLRSGNGNYHGETGIGGAYSFGSRFEENPGSNPEELLAAAEAACFSMALSGALEKNGMAPTSIETTARCTVEKTGDRFSVTKIDLEVTGRVPDADPAAFQRIAEETKEGCPVSRALKGNVQLTVRAKLA